MSHSRGTRNRIERCHYCGQKTRYLTKDHIVPRARGGADWPWNIVPACADCNLKKADSWPTCDCFKCRDSIRRHAARTRRKKANDKGVSN